MAGVKVGGFARVRVFSKKLLRCGGAVFGWFGDASDHARRRVGRGVGREGSGVRVGEVLPGWCGGGWGVRGGAARGGWGDWMGLRVGGGRRDSGGGEGGAISRQPAPRGGGLARDSLGRFFGRGAGVEKERIARRRRVSMGSWDRV